MTSQELTRRGIIDTALKVVDLIGNETGGNDSAQEAVLRIAYAVRLGDYAVLTAQEQH